LPIDERQMAELFFPTKIAWNLIFLYSFHLHFNNTLLPNVVVLPISSINSKKIYAHEYKVGIFINFIHSTMSNSHYSIMQKKLNQNQYEYLRFRSWELHQKGWKQSQIADALGVRQATISKWVHRAVKDGIQALHTRKACGPKAKLNPQDLILLKKHIQAGAQYHGYPDNRWTNQRIRKVIQKLFNVDYSVQHVGYLLKKQI